MGGRSPYRLESPNVADRNFQLLTRSDSPEWYTPAPIIDRVLQVLGTIDLDPCSNPAPYNVPAVLHYTQADGGLWRPWPGRVYMNPPYGKTIGLWVSYLVDRVRIGQTTAAIALLPVRTESRWFVPIWSAPACCFVRGRLHFHGPAATESDAPFASVLAYWGPDPARFAQVFKPLGHVLTS